MAKNRLMAWAAVVVLACSLGAIAWTLMGRPGANTPITKAYYTVDDGVSTFVDSVERQAPFEHDGREAVLAHVFSVDGNKTRFVGYLEKSAQDVARLREEAIKRGEPPYAVDGGKMLKRPGDPRWYTAQDGLAYQAITEVKGPNGETTNIEEVFP